MWNIPAEARRSRNPLFVPQIQWAGQGLVDTPVTCPEKEEQHSEQHSAGFLVNLIRPTRKY